MNTRAHTNAFLQYIKFILVYKFENWFAISQT